MVAALAEAMAPVIPEPASLDDVLAELRKIRVAMQAQAQGPVEFVNCEGAAMMLGVSRRTFFRLIEEGRLPKPIKLARQVRRWRRADLLTAMAKLETRQGRGR